MIKKYALSLLIGFSVCLEISAQQKHPRSTPQSSGNTVLINQSGLLQPSGFSSNPNSFSVNVPAQRNCGTMQNDAMVRAANPGMESLADFEQWLQGKIAAQAGQKQQAVVYTIPVVVHVIHNSTESVGQGRNISQAQVISQIDVLNEDFRRMNADTTGTPSVFQGVAADIEIEFCLAAVDPNGNTLAEPGIHRVAANTITGLSNTSTGYGQSTVNSVIKPATSWDPNNYMNIWVCQLQGGLLGYAQFPSSSGLAGMPSNGGAANTDGVVAGYNYFGRVGTVSSPFHKGRTTTHEVGHWLGLRHIWGDATCGTDYCNDTPVHNASNSGCPSQPHYSSCTGNPREMTQNYMDYTNDACMNIFTANQKTRMRTVMQNSPRRLSLLSSTVCNTSALPVADFVANQTTVTQGFMVNFTDLTTGNPTGWAWNFGGGGTPNTSTTQNPVIQFNTPGTYTVTLIASNVNGSDTAIKTNYIQVNVSTGCDTVTNLTSSNITTYTYDYYQPLDSGYLSGTNFYGDLAKADAYTLNTPNTHITGGIFYLGAVKDVGAAGSATFAVWNNAGTAGSPGAMIGSKTVPLSALTSGAANTIYFDSPIPATSVYYMGVVLPTGTGDSLSIYTTQHSSTAPNTGWEQWNDNTWHDYATVYSLNLQHAILPLLTDQPPSASFSASDSTFCEGSQVTFSSASSLNGVSYSWSFPGGTPTTSTQASPAVTYNASGSYPVTLTVYGACGSKDTLVQSSFINVSAAPAATALVTDASCNGNTDGSISVTVSGSTGPYNYSWSTGATTSSISGLMAGTYSVTVTDAAGCSSVLVENVYEPAVLSTAFNSVNESCGNANGSITSIPAGGTGPYSYSWSNGATSATISNLSAGQYIVTVTDANNCVVTDTSNLANSGTLALSTNSQNPTCGLNNGSVTAVPGGTAPYTYSWNTGATSVSISGLGAGNYTVTVTDANGCSSNSAVSLSAVPSPVASASSTNVTCQAQCNGTATAGVSGGVAPFTYSWNTSPVQNSATATNLCAGNYTVTVTDSNGCVTNANVTITQPSAIAISTSVSNETCNSGNGSISATVTGGTSGYTYNWNTTPAQTTATASNLQAGSYQLTVTDANGCQQTSTVSLINIGNTSASAGNDANICSGNTANLTAVGTNGTSPYTFSWSSGQSTQSISVSPSTTTTYIVTVTDANGCADADTVLVNVTQTPVISVSADTTICANLPVTLTATGASNYNWFPGGQTTASITVSPTASTTYSVLGSNGNCQGNLESVTITTLPNATAVASASPTTTYLSQGGNVQFTSTSTNATSVLWDFGDGNSSTQTNPSHTYLVTGTYTVILTAFRSGCEHYDTLTINVLMDVGINGQDQNEQSLNVYPNPASSELFIEVGGLKNNSLHLMLIDQLGRIVLNSERTLMNDVTRISTENFAAGVYYLRVTGSNFNQTTKIIINR